jgi:hypothetical protein
MPLDASRFEAVRAEWLAITEVAPLSLERFLVVKGEADALVAAGRWTSGPHDMLSILGRQRDELMHSRLIAWLLVPTNQHGLGRAVLHGFLDRLWPGEALLRSGPVFVETEVSNSAPDDLGARSEARADIILRGEGLTVVVENKLDAGEQPEQCERLYWTWANEPMDTRWVFLTPTGRAPMTARSDAARAAWRTMSYAELRDIVRGAIQAANASATTGRLPAIQYLETLSRGVALTR